MKIQLARKCVAIETKFGHKSGIFKTLLWSDGFVYEDILRSQAGFKILKQHKCSVETNKDHDDENDLYSIMKLNKAYDE